MTTGVNSIGAIKRVAVAGIAACLTAGCASQPSNTADCSKELVVDYNRTKSSVAMLSSSGGDRQRFYDALSQVKEFEDKYRNVTCRALSNGNDFTIAANKEIEYWRDRLALEGEFQMFRDAMDPEKMEELEREVEREESAKTKK